MRSLAFVGVEEPEVNRILECLNDLTGLPNRCMVFGSHMPHLAALCEQWKSQLDVSIVLVPSNARNVTEAAESILENAGLARPDTVWVLGLRSVDVRPPPGATILRTGNDDPFETARRVAAGLTQD